MISVQSILALQNQNIEDWHIELVLSCSEQPWNLIEENNKYNFLLWHEEDKARIVKIDPVRIVEAKRNIDKYNQLRNNAIEKIDEWVLNFLSYNNILQGETQHSETPGMMIDRLSIMALKKYHMTLETIREESSVEHRTLCKSKVWVLEEQIFDLSNCLERILKQIELGELKFKVYRQFKMYNDPSLNPQLYNRLENTFQ